MPATVSPDYAPAVRMREELARARRDGKDFDAVWQFAILRVTRELDPRKGSGIGPNRSERQDWVDIFAAQRPVWKAAYNREPVPDLLMCAEPDDE